MGGHGTFYQLMIRRNGQIFYATSGQGNFMTARQMFPAYLPYQFSTRAAAESCWTQWANRHPAWAAESLHEVVEAEA